MNNNFLVYATMLLDKYKPNLVMIIVPVIYAGMALLSKVAVAQGMNTYVFVTYRLTFATISLAPFAIFLEKKNADPLTFNVLWKTFLVSFFGMTLSLNLYCVALKYTTATLAAATTNTIPAITFVMASILRVESVSIKQRHGMAKVLGSLLSVSGALVFAFVKGPQIDLMNMSTGTTTNKNSSIHTVGSGMELVKGALIMFSANTFWSLWLIMQEIKSSGVHSVYMLSFQETPLMRQYPSTLRLTTLQCLFSCMQSAVLAVAVERHITSWKLGWDINLVSVLYCGVIVGGISYWLQLWGVKKKGPVFTAMFTPLALILTAIISAILWKEILHLGSVCGSVLLISGLYIVLWGKEKEAEMKDEEMRHIITPEACKHEASLLVECVTHR